MKQIVGLLMVLFGINSLNAMEKQEKPQVVITLNKIYNKTDKNIGVGIFGDPYRVIPAGKTSTIEYSFLAPSRSKLMDVVMTVASQSPDKPNVELKLSFEIYYESFEATLMLYGKRDAPGFGNIIARGTLQFNQNEELQILVDVIFNGPDFENDTELDVYALLGKPVKGLFKQTPQ